ncbi:MAG: patatin-like phospholipase family protein [Gemmatimonadota bacterium]
MPRSVFRLLLLLLSIQARVAEAQSCPAGPVALVLSGGGAKGLAHIGVLRALDSAGIRPDIVVGTSMGAIIGAMYASGYSGREIDSLSHTLRLTDLFRSYEPRVSQALHSLPPLVVWEEGAHGFVLQRAAVRESEVDALLNAALLRGNLLARGSFDSLPIPFRAVATDLSGRELVVLSTGDLARAVRASLSIPLVFTPEQIDNRFLGDGGLVANIPVAVARSAGATRVIVSDATAHLSVRTDFDSPLAVADQLLGFLFAQAADSLGPSDISIRPDVGGFASLDFSSESVDRLVSLGYQAAVHSLGTATCLPNGAPPARRPLPDRVFAVSVNGGRAEDRRYLRRILRLADSDTIDIRAIRSGLRALGASDRFRAIWLSPHGPRDSLQMDVSLREGPRRVAGLGLTYDNDLGGRMWLGAVDHNLMNSAFAASGAVQLGELRQEIGVGVSGGALAPEAIVPAVHLWGARELVRRFDVAGDAGKPFKIREAGARLDAERALGGHWRTALGVEGRLWHEPTGLDRQAVGLTAELSSDLGAEDPDLRIEARWSTAYKWLSVVAGKSFVIEGFDVRPGFRFGIGEHLPLHLSMMLGGAEGFPGLHVGELRGDRELLGDMTISHRLIGPLDLRLDLFSGRMLSGGSLLQYGHWLVGARIGGGAETPIGPVRVEYGRNDDGRDAMFVRLGRWF